MIVGGGWALEGLLCLPATSPCPQQRRGCANMPITTCTKACGWGLSTDLACTTSDTRLTAFMFTPFAMFPASMFPASSEPSLILLPQAARGSYARKPSENRPARGTRPQRIGTDGTYQFHQGQFITTRRQHHARTTEGPPFGNSTRVLPEGHFFGLELGRPSAKDPYGTYMRNGTSMIH